MGDSIRNLIVRLSLVTATSGGGTERLVIPTDDYFVSAEVRLGTTSDAVWTGTIVLFDPETADVDGTPFLERLFFAVGGNFDVELQWKLDDGTPIDEAPMYRGSVTGVAPSFQSTGVQYTLTISPSKTVDALAGTPPTLCAFKAGTRVTDVVRQIAAYHGWPTRAAALNGAATLATVEDADAVLRQDAQVVNEGHIPFIRSKLLPLVTNGQKRPYLFYFDEGGAVHFHSDFWLGSVRTYTFRDLTGEVKSFDLQNDSFLAQLKGGGNATFVGVDAAAGRFVTVDASRAAGVDASKPNAYGGASYAVEVTDGKARKAVVTRDRGTLQDRAAAAYNRFQTATFSATLAVVGTHALTVGAYVTVNRMRANGTLHFASGDYQIKSVTHAVRGGSWETTAEVYRPANLKPDWSTQASEAVSGLLTKLSRALTIRPAVPGAGVANAVVKTPQKV